MGNSKSGALSKEILEELQLNTKFTQEELCTWYQSFLKECPSGRISEKQFESIYSKFFPDADPKAYARHVFRSFDANNDGTLDFKEYMIALHMTSSGKANQKLEWAFSLYDVDGNGTINKKEVLEIITVRLFLCFLNSCCFIFGVYFIIEINITLPTFSPQIFIFLLTDKLTEGEFIQGIVRNKEILRLIQFEPQKVKEKLKEKKH
ncbi:S-modulin-like [Pyxicephalus adspersus]|uniref:S-modulin-like n=1 Tax=Pyxicephalus adspersus TaxID=30357 RepID=UPI003B5CDA01